MEVHLAHHLCLRHHPRDAPRGVTGRHLRTSLHMASTNGNLGRSSNVGSRSLPTTASISSRAFFCASGRSIHATKKVIMDETVWHNENHGPNTLYVCREHTVSAPAMICDLSRISVRDSSDKVTNLNISSLKHLKAFFLPRFVPMDLVSLSPGDGQGREKDAQCHSPVTCHRLPCVVRRILSFMD